MSWIEIGTLCFLLVGLARYALVAADPFLVWQRISHWNRFPGQEQPAQPCLRRAGNVPIPPDQAKQICQTVELLTRLVKPDQYLYVFSDDCAYYFLADRLNPTRYPVAAVVWDPRTLAEVIKNLADRKPACILAEGQPGHLRYQPYLQPLADYIQTHYQLAYQTAGHLFLVPKQNPRPTVYRSSDLGL